MNLLLTSVLMAALPMILMLVSDREGYLRVDTDELEERLELSLKDEKEGNKTYAFNQCMIRHFMYCHMRSLDRLYEVMPENLTKLEPELRDNINGTLMAAQNAIYQVTLSAFRGTVNIEGIPEAVNYTRKMCQRIEKKGDYELGTLLFALKRLGFSTEKHLLPKFRLFARRQLIELGLIEKEEWDEVSLKNITEKENKDDGVEDVKADIGKEADGEKDRLEVDQGNESKTEMKQNKKPAEDEENVGDVKEDQREGEESETKNKSKKLKAEKNVKPKNKIQKGDDTKEAASGGSKKEDQIDNLSKEKEETSGRDDPLEDEESKTKNEAKTTKPKKNFKTTENQGRIQKGDDTKKTGSGGSKKEDQIDNLSKEKEDKSKPKIDLR